MIVRACNEAECVMQEFPRAEHFSDLSLVGFLSIFCDTRILPTPKEAEV